MITMEVVFSFVHKKHKTYQSLFSLRKKCTSLRQICLVVVILKMIWSKVCRQSKILENYRKWSMQMFSYSKTFGMKLGSKGKIRNAYIFISCMKQQLSSVLFEYFLLLHALLIFRLFGEKKRLKCTTGCAKYTHNKNNQFQ